MSSQSPPKPWERGGAAATSIPGVSAAPSAIPLASTTATAASPISNLSSQPPDLPTKPSSLTSVVNRTASNYSPYGATPTYGSNAYGSYGAYNTYGSPYSRFSAMGNSVYGGYGGGYGSLYGGMGGGMYGGYPGRPGMMGEDPNSLTNSFNQSTQATFQLIEGIVGAFGGFAQMLESTYMATHSSFFAIVSVAEQFSNLRDTLGSILGIFTLLRWIRTLVAKLTGRPPPADATSLTPSAFARFQGRAGTLPDGTGAPPRPSRKPFVVFLLAAFGLPYLMRKLIQALARSQEETAGQQGLLLGPDGRPLPPEQQNQAIDPSQLDFCRLLYDYIPETQGQAPTPGIDLEVKKGSLVAVLAKTDPMGNASEWWRCRARDGRVGYLPSPYLEIIRRKPKQLTSGSPGDSRLQTMSSESGSGEQDTSISTHTRGPRIEGKVGDITAESFQKSQFYS